MAICVCEVMYVRNCIRDSYENRKHGEDKSMYNR